MPALPRRASDSTVASESRYPAASLTLAELLERAVERHPERVAWRFIERDESVTFAELLRYVNTVASGLRALGVVNGSHVAVMSTNRLAFCGTGLALARLGAGIRKSLPT